MNAERYSGLEYGTDRPCEIGRIVYTEGVRQYVALAFRHTDRPSDWRLTWIGEEGRDAARLPKGIEPSVEMLAALADAPLAAVSPADTTEET